MRKMNIYTCFHLISKAAEIAAHNPAARPKIFYPDAQLDMKKNIAAPNSKKRPQNCGRLV